MRVYDSRCPVLKYFMSLANIHFTLTATCHIIQNLKNSIFQNKIIIERSIISINIITCMDLHRTNRSILRAQQ